MRLAACVLAAAALAAQAQDPALVERARKEGAVTVYTSMQLVDSGPLTQAFEKKHGIKVSLWRASGEKVAQRALTEARGNRFEVDVVETDGAQMEILHREGQLAPLPATSLKDIPAAIVPAHRHYVPTRLTLYVLVYNTKLVAPGDVPNSYEDLLQSKWSGKVGLEAADVAWFAAVAKAMGEEKGIAYFRRFAQTRPSLRSGHTLMAELVAAGEMAMAVDAHVQGVARLKEKGAPVEWKALQPAFGQPSSVGVAKRAPHPNAAQLFAEFILSREGQEIIKSRNRVPSSTAVDSPLNKFAYALIDPAIALDEWDKWSRLFSEIFLGGRSVPKE
jgi:iron(III) transport system substrate-binding protein